MGTAKFYYNKNSKKHFLKSRKYKQLDSAYYAKHFFWKSQNILQSNEYNSRDWWTGYLQIPVLKSRDIMLPKKTRY